MLTASILTLLASLLCGWNGYSLFQNCRAFLETDPYFPTFTMKLVANPGSPWLVAAAIGLVLSLILLVCTLLTKKSHRAGRKFPFYVSEIGVALFGAALAGSTVLVNIFNAHVFNHGYAEAFTLSVWPIIFGGIILAIGLALLVIQILKGISSSFAAKVESTRFYGFFRDYKSEMKKIVWTSKKDVLRNTIVVVVTLVIVGVLLFFIDTAFGKLLGLLASVPGTGI